MTIALVTTGPADELSLLADGATVLAVSHPTATPKVIPAGTTAVVALVCRWSTNIDSITEPNDELVVWSEVSAELERVPVVIAVVGITWSATTVSDVIARAIDAANAEILRRSTITIRLPLIRRERTIHPPTFTLGGTRS